MCRTVCRCVYVPHVVPTPQESPLAQGQGLSGNGAFKMAASRLSFHWFNAENRKLNRRMKGTKQRNSANTMSRRELGKIFGPKRDGVTGGWRKLHNEELHNLYSSPSIIRNIKSRKMRWAGHVARMGRRGTCIGYWEESQRERDH
jgi:hypothetical protein